MKKFAAFLLSLLMAVSLAACSDTQQSRDPDPASGEESAQTAESAPAQTTETENGENRILIAYFTYGENAELPDDVDASSSASIQIFNGEITGNTGVMAHMIAEASGGELFSIRTAESYPDSYDDTIDVGQSEKNNGIHPELSTHIENLDQYDTVFVGFPNWLAYHKLIQCTFGCQRVHF